MLNKYQSGSPSYVPNTEADLGIDNYDYLMVLRELRRNAGLIYSNIELDKKADKVTTINGYQLIGNITLTFSDIGYNFEDEVSVNDLP